MKILQVFDIFSPHTNGTVKLLYQLSKALAQRGHEVTIYTTDFKSDRDFNNSIAGMKVYPFHLWWNFYGLRFTSGIIGEAKRSLKDFEVIHMHTYRSFQNIVVHHFARKYGVPYVMDAHGSMPRTAGGKGGLKCLFDMFLGHRILRDASKLVAETEVGIEEYKRSGVKVERIVLLPPPFSVDEFAQLPAPGRFRDKFGIKDKRIVMFFGRIHHIKGIDFLVEAFAELAGSRDDVILAIVGSDDGYKSALEEIIGRLSLADRVLFTGFLGGEEKLAALVDADVVVQTSRYEQGAWAPFEAVLCGTPIIVSRHTGAGEDVKRLDAGYLVEFGNKKELAGLINKILTDPREAREKAKRAAQYIRENMSMATRIQDYENLYAQCIEEKTINKR